ncbi:MAG: DUF1801 domain-containing protein [Candidatus Marinimicrobia bacterium]|nr:DUF1801 domain-containing protein [Candidatus Neomarinimicrobiota bacterium]
MNKIQDYISSYPPEIRERLKRTRECIRELIPEAEEVLAYGVPAFKLKKIVVMYAAHKKHIGFYPLPETIKAFKNKLKDYRFAEGTVQFPHNKELPLALIRDMVTYRLNIIDK